MHILLKKPQSSWTAAFMKGMIEDTNLEWLVDEIEMKCEVIKNATVTEKTYGTHLKSLKTNMRK